MWLAETLGSFESSTNVRSEFRVCTAQEFGEGCYTTNDRSARA